MLLPIDQKQSKKLAAQFNARRASKGANFAKEMQYFETAVMATEKGGSSGLIEAVKNNPESAQETFLEAVSLGLSWHPKMGQAYPVPYAGRVTLNIGYQGLLAIVARSGVLAGIQCAVVCKNDPVFSVWMDESGRHIRHEETRGDRGEITHAYCIATMRDGTKHIEVMGAEDFNAIQAVAKSKGLWTGKFRSQMILKSVIRRAWKFWLKGDNLILQEAAEALDRNEPIETTWQEVVSEDQAGELQKLIDDSGANIDAFLKHFGVPSLTDLPANEMQRAEGLLRQKISKKAKEVA
jgi:recombinational DNA repair protein RecT